MAALDLGTNTFLNLIADIDATGLKVVSDQIWLVRLGQGVNETRRFHPEALSRAKVALKEAAAQIQSHACERVLAVATSAARDVANKDELFAMGRELGIPIEIISGDLEAKLTFSGATLGWREVEGCAVIDVGGGSTELILMADQELSFHSVDVGSVRLKEQFITSYPIGEKTLSSARKAIRSALQAQVRFSPSRIRQVIAVAGTPTTLAAMDLDIPFDATRVDQSTLTLSKLQSWTQKLSLMTPGEIARRYRIEEKRADVIAIGSLILEESLLHLQATQVVVSTKGVRFGLAKALEKGEL